MKMSDIPEQHKSEGAPSGSVDCGDCCHEQLPPAPGGSPVRMRHNKSEGGSLTTSEVRPTPERPHVVQDPAKVKMFTRHGEDRIAYPKMSGRDFNSKGHKAPNMEKD